MHEHHLTFRIIPAADPAVRHLAEIDSQPYLRGDALLAERAGEPIAAISMGEGAVVADPFRPTAAETGLLRMRREQIRPRPERRARWRLLARPVRSLESGTLPA